MASSRRAGPSDIPALLHGARGGYGNTITAALAAAGFDDLPRNGPFVLAGMAERDVAAVDIVRRLGVSRQAASQLVDTLVRRGYLTRDVNADDRRRMDIGLTDRGAAAAGTIRAATQKVDAELAAMLAPVELAGLRAGLAALATIKERTQPDGRTKDV